MPIIKTYACPACNHFLEVTLTAEQWDDPPPSCPECDRREMQQEFKPFAIGGSASAQAHRIAEDIASNDYHVADMNVTHHEGITPSVRYKDPDFVVQARRVAKQADSGVSPSAWGQSNASVEQAIAIGRQTRLNYGSGLDILQHNIKTGAEPDLIANSKRNLIKIY